ncbi:MAG: hypothetical protein ACKVJK_22060, partial [Methylophagaceae bacterium]
VKHHAYNNTNQWTVDLKRAFNLEPGDLDQIAIVADLVSYGQPQTENFESKEYSLLEDTECPVYQVEHHLAHALSAPMFPKTTHQFVFDGAGELFLNDENVSGTVWSVFKDYTLTDNNISNFKQRRVTDSFGAEYENLARYMELTADHPEDLPGKLMSLQSHGEVCNEFLEYLTSKLTDVKTQLSISTHPSNWEDYWTLVTAYGFCTFTATGSGSYGGQRSWGAGYIFCPPGNGDYANSFFTNNPWGTSNTLFKSSSSANGVCMAPINLSYYSTPVSGAGGSGINDAWATDATRTLVIGHFI